MTKQFSSPVNDMIDGMTGFSDSSDKASFSGSDLARDRNFEHDLLFHLDNLGDYQDMVTKVSGFMTSALAQIDKPFTGIQPVELAKEFAKVDLSKPVGQWQGVLEELQQLYIKDAVYFSHPKYMAHLACPITLPSIAAELICGTINTSMDTWDQSGGGTFIEQTMIDWTASKIGYGSQSDGIFTSGGTQSNFMAMLVARDNFCLDHLDGHRVQLDGLPPEAHKFRIFASGVSHFSIQKAAAKMGLGFNSVVPVEYDDQFRMRPDDLEAKLEASVADGLIPIAVVATFGTTDFGSLDPVEKISEICQKRGIWLHADAAFGCGLLISQAHHERVEPLHLADSVTVDYHKSFFQPVSCSGFFVKNRQKLGCLTYHADYLNPLSQAKKGYPNLVTKSIQTTRRFDALKPWLTLRLIGEENLGQLFDELMDLAQRVYHHIEQRAHVETAHQPELSAVVFRFKPEGVTDVQRINEANEFVKLQFLETGNAMIASTKIRGDSYLKFTFLNPLTQLEDVVQVLDEIEHLGQSFSQSL